MSRDKKLLVGIWIITAVLLFKYIPRNKLRQGILVLLFKQFVTWFFGLAVVEYGLIQYPVRLFKKANKSSFSFEYFLYPAICAIFNVHYPEKNSRGLQFFYYLFFTSLLTFFEVLAERHTNLVHYVKWKWYHSFLTLGFTFYLSRLFNVWFFKKEGQDQEGQCEEKLEKSLTN